MVSLSEYITSFFRLNPEYRASIRISEISNDKYELKLKSDSPKIPFLPKRISQVIFRCIVQLETNDTYLDLSHYPNCEILILEGGDDKNQFQIVAPDRLHVFNSINCDIDNIIFGTTPKLLEMRIRLSQVRYIDLSSQTKLIKLELKFNLKTYPADLSDMSNLRHLIINGTFSVLDEELFNSIRLSNQVKILEIQSLMANTLDLHKFPFLKILIIERIKPFQTDIPDHTRGINVIWPPPGNELRILKINQMTLSNNPIIFNASQFEKLELLEYENHMTKKLIVEDLQHLTTFRTSPSRFVIGHRVDLYLINLPRLSKIRTAHRITKYILNCQQIRSEFSQNYVELDHRSYFS